MLINHRSLIRPIIIWTILSAPSIAAAGDWVPGDIGQPVSESGMGAEAPYFIQPFDAQSQRFEHGDPSLYEQYMLELINRARANPGAEAVRLAIDLNQGLSPGTILDTPKPPMAFHPLLIGAARAHSQWMLGAGSFSHTGSAGSSPGDRMEQAGYPFSGNWTWGENISWKGTSGTPDLTEFAASMHDGLFLSPGHRRNLMNDRFDEVGIGLLEGPFQQYNALMGTQKFALSGGTPGPLLTGVVYDDRNGNRFYDVGEGVAGVTIHLTGGAYHTVTSRSGGFALPYDHSAGPFELIFSGDPLPAPFRITVVGTGQNVKQDLIVTDPPLPAYALTIAKVGGHGAVTSTPAGIHCGATCSASFGGGTVVTLSATPEAGYDFSGWGGDCTNPTGTCTITMDTAKSVTAIFAAASTATHVLTITKAGTGSGTVTSTPAGIDCGTDCAASYSAGTTVTLTATPDLVVSPAPPNAFAGWSGGCTGTAPTCLIAMNAARNVTATFSNAGGGNNAAATTLITHYYVSILERTPEPDGLAFWQGLIADRQAAGIDVKPVFRDMANFFLNSPEYLGRNTSNSAFVHNLYRTFYQREPDAGGLAFWLEQLATGNLSRNQVIAHFLYLPEFLDFMQRLGF